MSEPNPIDTTNSSGRRPKPARGEQLVLVTESIAFEGKAVARRDDGYVIFVEGATSGERVLVEIIKAKGSFAEARIVEILEAGPDRRTPICPYFGTCGGCALQHVTYEAQLLWKKQQVIDVFERIGKIADPPVRDVLAAANEYHYRNQMEFSFSNERWLTREEIERGGGADRFALGLHVRERFDRVIDTQVCFLPNPIVADILDFTRRFVREHGLLVYGQSGRAPEAAELGLLRFLVIKTSHATGEIMVNIVTSRPEPEIMARYTKELVQTVPQVTTVVNNINSKRAQIAVGEYEIVLCGAGTIRDRIGNANYQISANSFFQANTMQAERLYEVATDYAELRSEDNVWDLYCGTGTISLFIAGRVKHVLGIELVESAVSDARYNAAANGIANVDFLAGDLKQVVRSISSDDSPTALIIDPPRSGMHADVVRAVLERAPERIAYISCNPATQARDVAMLLERYDLLELQPVDMFPQTFHIECVAKLRLRT